MRSRPLLWFLLSAYGWTWLLALPLLLQRRGMLHLGLPESWEAVTAFGPFVAALLVGGAAGRGAILDGLRRWRVGAGWLAFCCLSPFLLLVIAVAAVRAGAGTWPDLTALAAGELASLSGVLDLVLVAGLAQGLGEEPGWRGWLLPRLRQRYRPLAATLALFPLWLCWHLPQFLGRPEFGLAQFAAFAMGILAAAIWLTLIWEATGSILMAVIWHTSVNVARNAALEISTPHFLTFSTLVLLGAVVILVRWIRRGD
jgi:membrane protease YdiL (CAAX protease family)